MDGKRFDLLVRRLRPSLAGGRGDDELSQVHSRRGVLRLLAVLPVGGVLAGLVPSGVGARRRAKPTYQ